MGKLAIGLLAFAGGALAGGLFVKWYVETHPGELATMKIGEELFGAGSTGAKILGGIGTAVDQAFVQ